MRIDASQVDYGVREAFTVRREQRDRLRVEARPAETRVRVERRPVQEATARDAEPCDPRLWLARLMVEVLLGGRFGPARATARPAARTETVVTVEQRPPQWSVTLTHEEVYEENERLVVKARGAVRTAEGSEIRFDAEFTLERHYRNELGLSMGAGNAQLSDPLFLETGSGQALVVRDADGDGAVSNEGELFGARTGDAFAELSRLDEDGNGWIDAGDAAFGELRLRLDDGSLAALKTLGIGALATTGAAGEFHYKNEANELTAVVRRTGVYLTEGGQAGALRQIDLAV